MMLPLVAMALTAAPLKVAVSDFTANAGDAAKARLWSERFADVMRREGGVELVTPGDIAVLLGAERQRQLLGCDSGGCVAELAAALDAQGVLVGSINRTGDKYLVVIKVLRQPNGSVWWSASERVTGEDALLDWLDQQATRAARALAPTPPVAVGPLVLGGAGVATLGVGVTFLVLSNTASLSAVRGANSSGELATALEAGRFQGTLGVTLSAVGAATLAASLIWGLTRSRDARGTVSVTVVPSAGGGVIGVGGAW
jgi:hypothetical protein